MRVFVNFSCILIENKALGSVSEGIDKRKWVLVAKMIIFSFPSNSLNTDQGAPPLGRILNKLNVFRSGICSVLSPAAVGEHIEQCWEHLISLKPLSESPNTSIVLSRANTSTFYIGAPSCFYAHP